jgi:hypothetical protein
LAVVLPGAFIVHNYFDVVGRVRTGKGHCWP